MEKSIKYCGSITEKKVNRDAIDEFMNKASTINGIVIADGIGSSHDVEEAARWAVQFMKEEIAEITLPDPIDLHLLYRRCKAGIQEVFKKEINNNQFGTTLITVLERMENDKRLIKLAYQGNGAIWHIKGNFTSYIKQQLFPWCCNNYLNPHSIFQDGKEVLNNCISLEPFEDFRGPSTMEFSCDTEYGDIIMACTDGIYSQDQSRFSKDGYGALWQRHGESFELFINALAEFISGNDFSASLLKSIMDTYLEKLRSDGLLEDDATFGLIITPEVFQYQNQQRYE
jgi:PPM family protein phosphatase